MSRTILLAAAAAAALAFLPRQAPAHDEPVAGSLIGAGVGAIVGGPAGAAVGAVLGAGIGSHVAHESDHGRHVRAEHRHYSRAHIERPAVRYYAPARHANGNGSARVRAVTRVTTVHCEPEPAHAPPTVVYRDKDTRVVHVPAPKPKAKVKKVCRYVPVKAAA